MTKLRKLFVFLTAAALFLSGCAQEQAPPTTAETIVTTEAPAVRDFAAELELDLSSPTAKQAVTVKSFVDGDTVHFHVPEAVMEGGVFKARFLAVNTPESTGKIEEYGKKAAAFTKETLSAATSILIESETDSWNPDSTGTRHLVWVWYKTGEDAPYRNLNVELLQNGLANANSSSANRYGDTCVAALEQARVQKRNLYSGQPDPDFCYGEAVELTLKELRTNIEAYDGQKVAFSGIVTANSGTQGVYVEAQDPESGLYSGIYVYYGHGLPGPGLEALTVGNEARIVGTVQYYEAGGTWQVSDLSYRLMQPEDPGNVRKLSEGHSPAYVLTDAETFAASAEKMLGTSVEMRDLKVLSEKEGSSPESPTTLTCDANGIPVTVRTAPMVESCLGRTISVRGIVDIFDGDCQIKVFIPENITIQD